MTSTQTGVDQTQATIKRIEEEPAAPVMTEIPLEEILKKWRPGSYDWAWQQEFDDLKDSPVTKEIEARVDKEGISFVDCISPVLLGSDGRVWDGHHRIVIAMKRGITTLNVEIVSVEQRALGELTPKRDYGAQCVKCTRLHDCADHAH